ncbi:hypothetical protein BH20ACT22_BH20ACT22_01860 [soil metagenome]
MRYPVHPLFPSDLKTPRGSTRVKLRARPRLCSAALATALLASVLTTLPLSVLDASPASAAAGAGVTKYKINTGGPSTSSGGWSADTVGAPSAYIGSTGSKIATTTRSVTLHSSVPSGVDPAIFKDERYKPPTTGNLETNFPVTAGRRYDVHLYFAEIYSGCQAVGCRKVDVNIEGRQVLNDHDTFAEVGGYKGLMKTFTVTPTDANLDINFVRVVKAPHVTAMEIIELPSPECSDGQDNDGDGAIDYPADQGCDGSSDDSEAPDAPQCSDRLDNDGDGKNNYPNDPGCSSPADNDETDLPPVSVGNGGTEPSVAGVGQQPGIDCASVPGEDVNPGGNIQAALNASSSVCLNGPGVYRTGNISPGANDTLVAEDGAVISGAKTVTDWSASGATWVSTGQTFTPAQKSGSTCERPGYPRACDYVDVYRSNRPMRAYASLSALESAPDAGFFFDYAADKVFINRTPVGQVLELTDIKSAGIQSSASGITLRNVRVEKFAGNCTDLGSGAQLDNVTIFGCHSHGARMKAGSTTRDSYIAWQGTMGSFGSGIGLLLQNNEFAYNNHAGFGTANGGPWHAGNTKFASTTNLKVTGNYMHHSRFSDGFWTDINNVNSEVWNNRFSFNDRFGYFHEISCSINLHHNTFEGNGSDGIRVSDSNDGVFAFNTFKNNKGRSVNLSLQSHNMALPKCLGTNTTRDVSNTMKRNSVHDNTSTNSGAFTCSGYTPCDGGRENRIFDNTMQ